MNSTAAQSIVQAVIDLPALQQFLHPEMPERKPLVLIAGGAVTPELALSKFGQRVEIVKTEDVRGRPYLEITDWKQDGAVAAVKLAYPVEGVKGEVELQQTDGKWIVSKSRVWER